jgi:hypothetical protein
MSHGWGADTGVETTAGRVEYFIDWKHAQIERSHSVTPVSCTPVLVLLYSSGSSRLAPLKTGGTKASRSFE